MAVGFRLSRCGGLMGLAAAAVCVLVTAGEAVAQAQTAPPAAGTDPKAVKNSDCSKLPGGNAPVQRLARLEGGMSVRNLELTYFGKPLFQLDTRDIDYIRRLWGECETFEKDVADRVAKKLTTLISDARAARQTSLDWINDIESQLKELKPGEEAIRTVHDMWQEMLNREFEMLPTDLQYLAGLISKKREELYTAQQQRQRTLVKPFDPGPAETRDLRN